MRSVRASFAGSFWYQVNFRKLQSNRAKQARHPEQFFGVELLEFAGKIRPGPSLVIRKLAVTDQLVDPAIGNIQFKRMETRCKMPIPRIIPRTIEILLRNTFMMRPVSLCCPPNIEHHSF